MSSLEELEQRMAAMEAELAIVRQEAAAARALAAGADRDVAEYRAELRGHTRLLTALRETQVEQGQALGRIDDAVGALDDRVDQLTGTVGHIRDQHGASLTQIVGLLNQLIDRDNGQE
jgi:hypothetical protein